MASIPTHEAWPDLPYSAWRTLRDASSVDADRRQNPARLHAWLNHSWHVPFYVTARGLTTSPIPCRDRSFEIDFDFRTICSTSW